MTGQEFKELLALGYERKNIEFKGAGPRSASQLFAKVVRAVLGMSNQQDGGIIVIGVEEDNGVLRPVGMNDFTLVQISSWCRKARPRVGSAGSWGRTATHTEEGPYESIL